MWQPVAAGDDGWVRPSACFFSQIERREEDLKVGQIWRIPTFVTKQLEREQLWCLKGKSWLLWIKIPPLARSWINGNSEQQGRRRGPQVWEFQQALCFFSLLRVGWLLFPLAASFLMPPFLLICWPPFFYLPFKLNCRNRKNMFVSWCTLSNYQIYNNKAENNCGIYLQACD